MCSAIKSVVDTPPIDKQIEQRFIKQIFAHKSVLLHAAENHTHTHSSGWRTYHANSCVTHTQQCNLTQKRKTTWQLLIAGPPLHHTVPP